MIYCPKCKEENDEESLFCRKCDFPLDEETSSYGENSSQDKQKRQKNKTKNKRKTKTKVKKAKNSKQKGKMSLFQSFMMFFFIILSICALAGCAYLGYYIYQNQNIVVPDVTGYTYETAEQLLKDSSLQATMVEEVVTDESEVGVVIKQSKKAGSKVMENTVIKLTVGVLDTSVTVPDVEGLTLDEALEKLNENNVKYEIVYEDSNEDNIVLSQSIKAGQTIENTQTVTITVSKQIVEETTTEEAEDTSEETVTN